MQKKALIARHPTGAINACAGSRRGIYWWQI